MNAFLWTVAALLAIVLAASGSAKLALSKEKLVTSGQAVLEDFGPGSIKAIGAAEILAAIGLVLPPVLDIGSVLAPIAAACLALLMVGAATVHLRRKETPGVIVTLTVLVLAAVVAWGRFGPESFSA